MELVFDKAVAFFNFEGIYELADMVQCCAEDGTFIEDIGWGWKDRSVKHAIAKPQRFSLLHDYIFHVIRIKKFGTYRADGDIYGSEDAELIQNRLENYGLSVKPFDKFCEENQNINESDKWWEWVKLEHNTFLEYYYLVSDPVHHVLFSNRAFLLDFNEGLAEHLSNESNLIPPQCSTSKGKVKRVSIPQWLRKAVFHRDVGRCVLCQRDLSGLISTNRKLHFDHMVPLDQYGTNDPSNFQLLCEKCNLDKSGTASETGHLYNRWWPPRSEAPCCIKLYIAGRLGGKREVAEWVQSAFIPLGLRTAVDALCWVLRRPRSRSRRATRRSGRVIRRERQRRKKANYPPTSQLSQITNPALFECTFKGSHAARSSFRSMPTEGCPSYSSSSCCLCRRIPSV
jgi:HNH endonuclease